MATICVKCGKVLTTEDGQRINDTYFDSNLRKRRLELLIEKNISEVEGFKKGIVYMWCYDCYNEEKGKQD